MADHTNHPEEIFKRLRTFLLEKTFGLEVHNVSRFPEEDVDTLKYVAKRGHMGLLLRLSGVDLVDEAAQGREERLYNYDVRFIVKDPTKEDQFTLTDLVAFVNYWLVRNKHDSEGQWVNIKLSNVTYDEPESDGKVKTATGTLEVLRDEC